MNKARQKWQVCVLMLDCVSLAWVWDMNTVVKRWFEDCTVFFFFFEKPSFIQFLHNFYSFIGFLIIILNCCFLLIFPSWFEFQFKFELI